MAETLATIRDRVELLLQDSSNDKYTTGLIDETIRQALTLYNEKLPLRVLDTVTLSAAGREIDVSSVDFKQILRVWWDYDSSDPAHPPHWRSFEVWDDRDILYINDPDEPASGDVVRLWLEQDHTINGLESATATTIPTNHTHVLTWGAAGFAALSRALKVAELSNVNKWAERNLREWGESQVNKFLDELDKLARANAAAQSGIIPASPLDRYEGPWN